MYPWQTITGAIVLIIAYLIIKNISRENKDVTNSSFRRRAALQQAKLYLAPYTDINRNLRLSNTYCSLRLGRDGKTITAKEKVNSYRSFRLIRSNVHSVGDLWNMFCINFDYNTTFEGLVELCNTFNAEILIDSRTNINKTDTNTEKCNNDTVKSFGEIEQKEKLDVNNASEVELTALPGVSIVMAKKLIKKREEIGGFKTVDDVCLFLRLKPHMQTQLEKLICVKKMHGSVKVGRYQERKLDL